MSLVEFAEQAPTKHSFWNWGGPGRAEGGGKIRRSSVPSVSDALFGPFPGPFLARFWWILALFGGFNVLWGSTFWDFRRILRPVGEHFLGHLEDLTSCGEALFGAFGGFNILWGSTFEEFWKILRPVGEHFLELLEDLTSCGGALFGTFWRI